MNSPVRSAGASVNKELDTWNQAEALDLARKTYLYAARMLPLPSDYEAIGEADRRVLEAEGDRDMTAYVDALRSLCLAAREKAMGRAA